MRIIGRKKKISLVLVLTMVLVQFVLAGTAYAGEAYQFVTKWNFVNGSGDGQLNFPNGLAMDKAGNFYIVDTQNSRIVKYDPNFNFIGKWGSLGSGDGQFNFPYSIAIDNSDNVYVTDYSNHRIQKFDTNGNFITKWGSSGTGDGQFGFSMAKVAVDSVGNVYVADWGNNRIQKFNSNGNFITKWGIKGSSDGQLSGPDGLAIDSAGNVYISDSNNGRIEKFSTTDGINYNFVTKWGSPGNNPGQFYGPASIAFDPKGNVLVIDSSNHRIQKFTENGTFITWWGKVNTGWKDGTIGTGDGEFHLTNNSGIVVDSQGYVYVVDTYNYRIQKFKSVYVADATPAPAPAPAPAPVPATPAPVPTYSGTLVQNGASGQAVSTIQDKLKNLGFDCGATDGMFGPKTLAAVTNFQSANGLVPDGIIGPLTWGKLFGFNVGAYNGLVTYGNTNPTKVGGIQDKLISLGFNPGLLDGLFGPKTLAAVKAFQQAKGLVVDGIIGPITWQALFG